MTPQQLIESLREQRRSWVDVGDLLGHADPKARRVRITRPPEAHLTRFRDGITVETMNEYVDGWDGFTEADILGPAIGASSPAEFSPELWSAFVADQSDMLMRLAGAISDSITEHLKKRDAAKGNSKPSSTGRPPATRASRSRA